MSHEHPPEEHNEKYSEEIMDLVHEYAEAKVRHDLQPDPKDASEKERIRKELMERHKVDPEKLPEEKPKKENHNDHKHDNHGHGEEAKKGFFRRLAGGTVGVGAVGGGLFTGLIGIFANSLWNTIRGKDGGGGGGGGHKSGGGGHGGGGHH